MREKSAKVNVLFVIMQMSMGGSERLVYNLTAKLDRKRFNPAVLWFEGEAPLKEFVDLHVPLYHVPKRRGFDIDTMRKIANVISEHNIHAVNAQHFMPMFYSFYGARMRNRVKLFYTAHSEWELEGLPRKWRIMGRFLINHSDGLIGVTDKVSDSAIRHMKLNKNKVFTIENGVDLNFSEKKDKSGAIKKVLGIGDKDTLIGIVANLSYVKNHIFLLKGFKELLVARSNVKLLIIGAGGDARSGELKNMEPELRDFVEKNSLSEFVRFLGYRADVRNILGAIDIFCLTSFKEGLPISLLEAMASGLPVVGTDVEGIHNVIEDKRTGYLVKNNDVNGLKEALAKLVDSKELRDRLGHSAKTMVMEKFSLRDCLKKYEDIFLRTAETL